MSTLAPRGTLWALAGFLALAMILPFASAAPAPTFTPPNPGASPQSWAYGTAIGASGSVTGTLTTLSGTYNYQIESHSFLSWNVIFTQTNTSSTTFTINATRTVGAALFVEGCVPSCSNAAATINITATGTEQDYAWANFTTAGTVWVNGTTPVAAVALENEQITVAGNLSGQANWQVQAIGGRSATSGNAYVGAQVNAAASAVFTPSLGLFPMNPSVGQMWNSTAAYTASGSYSKSCHSYDSSLGAVSCAASGSLQGSGVVNLVGADTGWGVSVNGHSYPFHVITLGLTSTAGSTYTFDAVDGLFLLPHASNLFSANNEVTSSTTAPGISTNAVDLDPGSGHVGPSAAKGELGASISTGDLSSVGGLGPAAFSAVPAQQNAAIQPLSAQAAPESVGTASSANSCILSGVGCASPAASGKLGGLVFLGVLIAVVAVIVAVVASRRSSKVAPPPAGVVIAPRPPNPGTPGAPRPTGQDQDPLGNLW